MFKTTIFSLSMVFFLYHPVFAQSEEQKTLAKFMITDANFNGVDRSDYLIDQGVYTVFYTSGNDGLVYMANVWPKDDTQSYGPMYSVSHEEHKETSTTYKADVFVFKWKYVNSYDSEHGTADVQVTKIYKPAGIAFMIKVVPPDLDVFVYKGYMEGSIDFSVFD